MSAPVLEHVLSRITATPIRTDPYAHLYVRDVFPADFFKEVRAHLPPFSTYTTLKALERVGKNYSDSRFVFPVEQKYIEALDKPLAAFWSAVAAQFLTGEFMRRVLAYFAPHLGHHPGGAAVLRCYDEAFIVRDRSDYNLGPHTDSVGKVVSLLFYLPPDESMSRLGTSMYTPKQAGFVCTRGKHYKFDGFQRLTTMPYVPNALFAFARTSNSFHGVEPITEAGVCRDLLLYDIQLDDLPPQQPTSYYGDVTIRIKI